jgi:hypothetical protein
VGLLDEFTRAHGAQALRRLDDNLARLGRGGDLIVLARALVAAAREPRRERKELQAWLDGVRLQHTEVVTPVGPLSDRTAKRALAELTAIVRALEHAGLLVILMNGDVLTKLPAGRRMRAYTLLRELVDNADGGRGLVATRLMLVGGSALVDGPKGLGNLRPLATRLFAKESGPPPPHRPVVTLAPGATSAPPASAPPRSEAESLRAILRAAQGLPPVESVIAMSVGQTAIDHAIDELFAHTALDSSVFALLTGDYGTGKTHLLLHLAARALADRRPVLRLSLEESDADLGNPQRHLRRLLEQATLPLAGRPGPLDRLYSWTRDTASLDVLEAALDDVIAGDGAAAETAAKLRRHTRGARHRARAIEGFLGAADLVDRAAGSNYRRDAYGRLLLWLELIERLERCAGPVLLIDEAENLYTGSYTKAERRTALRSLSFYCGGNLPRACVIMAITPSVLEQMRAESAELLEAVAVQKTLLVSEDAAMLRRRLARIHPIEVPVLRPEHRQELLARLRAVHVRVRGPVDDAGWEGFVKDLIEGDPSPRELVRRAVDRLESSWWYGR